MSKTNIDQKPRLLKNQDYIYIDEMPEFNKFVKQKNKFLIITISTFLFIYILLPLLAFQPILQTPVIGSITGVWIYSAGLFLMTIIACTIYVNRAAKFDESVEKIMADYNLCQEENSV